MPSALKFTATDGLTVALDATSMTQDSAGNVKPKAAGISGAMLAPGCLDVNVAVGGNGAGARTCTGAAVGDRVVSVISRGDAGASGTKVSSSFETTITVVNQIQQTATDLSSDLLDVFLIKA